MIGHSAGGRAITAYEMGDPASPIKAVLLGQMHGDEHAGVTVANALLTGGRAITGIDLWVIPTMNPDGNAANTRANARGVDLNRNWPDYWVRDQTRCYTGPDPLIRAGGCDSGSAPLSEPETRAMYAFLKKLKPRYLVSLHQPLNAVDSAGGDARNHAFRDRVARGLGLPVKPLVCWSFCHGSMTGWLADHTATIAVTAEFPAAVSATRLRSAGAGIVTAMGGRFVTARSRDPVLKVAHATSPAPGVASLDGYAYDLDARSTALTVTVVEGGARIASAKTSVTSAAVNRAARLAGRHGYRFTFAAKPGRHRYCLIARNVGAGVADTKVCRTVTVAAATVAAPVATAPGVAASTQVGRPAAAAPAASAPVSASP
ncbi:MAG: hypothetical protein FWD74_09400 [Actinomycetia bacterium]|nr:hypothetical protein [Actinomycetes bacterium]